MQSERVMKRSEWLLQCGGPREAGRAAVREWELCTASISGGWRVRLWLQLLWPHAEPMPLGWVESHWFHKIPKQNLAQMLQLKHKAEWETFAQAAYQKEPERGFPSYVSWPLVAPDFDCGSECWCKKRTCDLLLPLLPHHKIRFLLPHFFFCWERITKYTPAISSCGSF